MGKATGVFLLIVLVVCIEHATSIDQDFYTLMKHVISEFKPWAHKNNREQFAVMMFMGNKPKYSEFKFSPSPDKGKSPELSNKLNIAPEKLKPFANYIAAYPTNKHHAEEYVLANLNKLYNNYATYYKNIPDRIILYSWIVPCVRRKCSEACKSSCTNDIINDLRPFTEIGTEIVVAYTTMGSEVKDCECDPDATRKAFENTPIKYFAVKYGFKEFLNSLLSTLIE